VVIEILNPNGKKVESFTLEPRNSGTLELNISHLPAGIYFIRFSFDNQMIQKKIIKL
jgi:uncharacterized protein YfaS (alpha-2-macroglobulin family)